MIGITFGKFHFPWRKGDLRVLSPATFGYQAPFSLIIRRGRSREPLIQTFRDLLKSQLNVG